MSIILFVRAKVLNLFDIRKYISEKTYFFECSVICVHLITSLA